MDAVIQTENLSKRFGQRVAVEDINLLVRPGEIYGFLGPNGGGKTFLLQAYAGKSGRVVIRIKNMRSMYYGQTSVLFELFRWYVLTFGKILILVDEAHTAFGSVHSSTTHEAEKHLGVERPGQVRREIFHASPLLEDVGACVGGGIGRPHIVQAALLFAGFHDQGRGVGERSLAVAGREVEGTRYQYGHGFILLVVARPGSSRERIPLRAKVPDALV